MAYLLQISHLPLLINDVNTNFLLGTKCWLRGGVGGQFPRILHWRHLVVKGSVLPSYKESVLQMLFYTESSKDLPVRNKRVLQKNPYNDITPRDRLNKKYKKRETVKQYYVNVTNAALDDLNWLLKLLLLWIQTGSFKAIRIWTASFMNVKLILEATHNADHDTVRYTWPQSTLRWKYTKTQILWL